MLIDLNESMEIDFNATLNILNFENYAYFFGSIVKNKNTLLNSIPILSSKFYELISDIIDCFTRSQYIKFYVIHLIDKFYGEHIKIIINKYKNLKTEEDKENNSWQDIMTRIKRQIPLRIVTCIFIAINYKSRKQQLKISDCIYILTKFNYSCSYEKFQQSQLRILKEIDYELEFNTLLDCVMCLLSMIKYNIELEVEFYFPAMFDLINLIYGNEMMLNDVDFKEREIFNFKYDEHLKRTIDTNILIYACLVIDLVPILIGHPKTIDIFNELIIITKIEPTNLISLRHKYLFIILNENSDLRIKN